MRFSIRSSAIFVSGSSIDWLRYHLVSDFISCNIFEILYDFDYSLIRSRSTFAKCTDFIRHDATLVYKLCHTILHLPIEKIPRFCYLIISPTFLK
eukprot:snap_masked-scaffold_1-processed-gene-18.10-mRNA-1 protein AED:1.00 eAED:1.00 QI:0/0/0/0/1/1/3/0/94